MAKGKRKCGPNWIPKWVFNDPVFEKCCIKHDLDYENQIGKLKADIKFLKCNWKRASEENTIFWRLLEYIQGTLLFSMVIFLPWSYIVYYIMLRKN